MYKYFSLFLTLLSFHLSLQAQLMEQPNLIPVYQNGELLRHAWAGGLNSSQFSQIDLDRDGHLDFVIYDQKGSGDKGRVMCYLNNGETSNPYRYSPRYNSIFDTLLTASLITAKDINKDSIPDLVVTQGNDFEGLLLYEGFYDTDNQYNFSLRQEIYGYMLDDLRKPAVVDVDGDGFLDILKINTADDGVNLLRNLGRDTLAFEVEECWGNFIKFPLMNKVQLDTDCSHTPKTSATTPKHFFSALSAFDADGDEDIDLFFSNSGSNYANYLINGGTTQQATITAFQDSFPIHNPINLYSSCYFQELDVDNDGNLEWLVTPQDPDNAATVENVQVYDIDSQEKDQFPQITLRSSSFLVDQMIDVGEFSHPVFFDYNQDGLMDIIISNYRSINNTKSSIPSAFTLLKNIGTIDMPVFELITKDYQNLSEQNYFGAIPAFGDLDGDGDEDMVVTTYFKNFLFYYQNNPNEMGEAQFTLVNDELLELRNILSKSPYLYDINQDGLLDFILGNFRGNIHYYQNIGTSSTPLFELVTENWGQVKAQLGNSSAGASIPIVNDWDQNDTLDLWLGDIQGTVQHYLVNSFDPNTNFEIVYKPLPNIQVGTRSTLAMHDLNNDQLPEILVGSFSGGIQLFSQSNTTSVGINPPLNPDIQLEFYPNPTRNTLYIKEKSNALDCKQSIQVFDSLGRLVFKQQLGQSKNISFLPYAKGIYFIQYGNNQTEKIIYY